MTFRLLSPEWFAVEMRISTSMSEAMVHSWKSVECPLWVGGQVAAPSGGVQVYLGFVLKRGELGNWCSLGSSVGAVLVCCGEETSVKVSLSVYRLIYVLTLTCGHKLCVVTERIRSQVQVMEMSFLRRVSSFSLRNGVRTSE